MTDQDRDKMNWKNESEADKKGRTQMEELMKMKCDGAKETSWLHSIIQTSV